MLAKCIGTPGRCGAATPGDFHRKMNGFQYKIDCLAGISLVSNNASVIQVTNHGQIENSFFGLNIRNIRDPLLVRIVSVKLTVQQIVVSMFIIAHLLPLLSAANLA